VRNIVGLLVAVGMGAVTPDAVPQLVAARDRARLPSPAPAHGLTLEAVYYDVGWGGAFDHPLHASSGRGSACEEEREEERPESRDGLLCSEASQRT
jgi:hypothetical protein